MNIKEGEKLEITFWNKFWNIEIIGELTICLISPHLKIQACLTHWIYKNYEFAREIRVPFCKIGLINIFTFSVIEWNKKTVSRILSQENDPQRCNLC